MSIARDCSCRIIQSWRKKEDNRKLYILTSRELDGDVRSGIVNASYPDFSYDGEGWKYGLKVVVVTQYEATPPPKKNSSSPFVTAGSLTPKNKSSESRNGRKSRAIVSLCPESHGSE
mgnify:CR=1 FL=1